MFVYKLLMAVACLDWVLKARSNNGTGPDLMMENVHGEDSVHAFTLRTTLGEHKQHCSSLLVSPAFQLYGNSFENAHEALVMQDI